MQNARIIFYFGISEFSFRGGGAKNYKNGEKTENNTAPETLKQQTVALSKN